MTRAREVCPLAAISVRSASEQAFERFPEEFGATGDGTPPGMIRIYLATSPDRYPSFVARESGVLMLVAVLATAAALATVHLRRPE